MAEQRKADPFALDMATVAAHLSQHGLSLDAEQGAKRLSGGLSNLNYLVAVNGRPAVLRRPPAGDLPPGAHDMSREHRILSRLWRVHPLAPESLHLCEDKSVIGVPFQLIDYRPGLVIKGDDRSRFDERPELARATSNMLVATLISVHRVDCAAIGLDTLGKPEGFIARTLKGWAGRGQRLDVAPETARLLAEVTSWLERQPVQTRAPVLLHSDFKLDNMIVHPETLAPIAIVDWDMGTRGDPLFDLATTLSYWVEPDDPPCLHTLRQMPTAAPGFARRREVLTAYGREMGIDVSDWPALRVLALLKLAVVLLQLFALYQRGAAKGADYAELDRVATELLGFATDVAYGRAD
jgi:aminoglycoside phosphotransferase (APT) family kinase protein